MEGNVLTSKFSTTSSVTVTRERGPTGSIAMSATTCTPVAKDHA